MDSIRVTIKIFFVLGVMSCVCTRVFECKLMMKSTLSSIFSSPCSLVQNEFYGLLTCFRFCFEKLYAESLARFQGGSPYIYPLYGLGELPQVCFPPKLQASVGWLQNCNDIMCLMFCRHLLVWVLFMVVPTCSTSQNAR